MFGGRSKLDKGLDAFEKSEWKRARKLLEDALQEEPARALAANMVRFMLGVDH